jgi:SAM-dependent methyltransferase
MKPGYNQEVDIYSVDDRICKSSLNFMKGSLNKDLSNLKFADVGAKNKKSDFISANLNIVITQLIAEDFNFDDLVPDNGVEKFDVITCFEVIEHLQNPLFLMKQMTEKLKAGGIIFLSTPSRPRMFWPDYHFNEMNDKQLDKWIFSQAGMKIVKKDRLKIHLPMITYFTGIRPFMRLFINNTNIYELRHKI